MNRIVAAAAALLAASRGGAFDSSVGRIHPMKSEPAAAVMTGAD